MNLGVLAFGCYCVLFTVPAKEAVTTITPMPVGTAPVVVLDGAPVVPGHRYALEWMMLVEGEKAWRYRADFAGAVVAFKDASGEPIKAVPRYTSCWSTDGWRPAWYSVEAPLGAASLALSFAIQSKDALPGRFRIRDAHVHDLAEPAQIPAEQGGLEVTVYDETGNLTPSRVYVRGTDHQAFTARNAFSCSQGDPLFYGAPSTSGLILVPTGKYRISAMKGFEYEIANQDVEAIPGKTVHANLTLRRRFNLGQSGWWSGDHHTHLFRHGGSYFPMMNLQDVYAIAKGEGLAFLPFMGLDKGEHGADELAEPGFLGRATEELTRDFWGHICPIGTNGNLTLPEHGDANPMNLDYIAEARRHDIAIAYAHPYGPLRRGAVYEALTKTKSGLIAREFPVDVALGASCTLDILAKEDAEGDFALKLRDYMWLLDLGFHIGLSGSTDFHLDQGRQPIGGLRTYVHAGQLTWTNIAGAYREGRTFATNGPLLLFTVNGKGPGETVNLGDKRILNCVIDARSLWEIRRVQIWQDGVVVKEINATDGQVHANVSLPVERTGWLLAIADGAPAPEVMQAPEGKPLVNGQYAITSPVYISARAPAASAAEAADYFAGWVSAVEQGFSQLCSEAKDSDTPVPERLIAETRDRLAKAKRVFAERGASSK